jgi:hypothetical protein
MATFYPCRSFAAGKETAATEVSAPSPYSFSDSAIQEFEGWTACETCQALIERTAIEALAQRVYSLNEARNLSEWNPIDYYRATFLLFFEHRTGPAYSEA